MEIQPNPDFNPVKPENSQPAPPPLPPTSSAPVAPTVESAAPTPSPSAFPVQTNTGIQGAILTPPSDPDAKSSAGTLILQWLTYAFWGWAVLSLSLLTSLVITSAMKASTFDSFTPYAIAAVLVLLPISVICDLIYSRNEPSHKVGPAMVIMVIHAVIFALFGIASLISVAFSIVQLATSSSESTGTTSMLFTSLIIAVIYGITFLRTLSPASIMWFRKIYIGIMIATVGLMAILGFIGPVSQASTTKDDKLIEQSLPTIQNSISTYAQTNQELPASLSNLRLQSDAKILMDRNLVTYKPNSIPPSTNSSRYATAYSPASGDKTYYYELCVKYKREDTSKTQPYGNDLLDKNGYSTYLSPQGHPAGDVCYKMKEDIIAN